MTAKEDGRSRPADGRAAAASAVEPVSAVSSKASIPNAERGCDVCDRQPISGVACSSLGPISLGYCAECAAMLAEPEWMFAMTYEDCGTEVAEWVKGISTWKDGKYLSWPEWVGAVRA